MPINLTAIPFTSLCGNIRIQPRIASDARFLDRIVSLFEFGEGMFCKLYRTENGDLFCEAPTGEFITGPQVGTATA